LKKEGVRHFTKGKTRGNCCARPDASLQTSVSTFISNKP
jgi:hypothetical protein